MQSHERTPFPTSQLRTTHEIEEDANISPPRSLMSGSSRKKWMYGHPDLRKFTRTRISPVTIRTPQARGQRSPHPCAVHEDMVSDVAVSPLRTEGRTDPLRNDDDVGGDTRSADQNLQDKCDMRYQVCRSCSKEQRGTRLCLSERSQRWNGRLIHLFTSSGPGSAGTAQGRSRKRGR